MQTREPCALLWGYKVTQPLWNSMAVPQKLKSRAHVTWQIPSRDSSRCLYTCVHSSVTHKSKNVETNHVSIKG